LFASFRSIELTEKGIALTWWSMASPGRSIGTAVAVPPASAIRDASGKKLPADESRWQAFLIESDIPR
jgi:hypothetical protein